MDGGTGPERIRGHRLLFVEGQDEKGFLKKLLNSNSMDLPNIDIKDVRGKNQFNEVLPTLKVASGFNQITHLGIIRDADDNFEGAFKSIQNILQRKLDISPPPQKHGEFIKAKDIKVGIFIMPGRKINGGSIEDLCLKIVEKEPATECVNKYIKCLNDKKIHPNNITKSKLSAYLASREKHSNTIRVAAEMGYWDFNSSHLDELKEFLRGFSS